MLHRLLYVSSEPAGERSEGRKSDMSLLRARCRLARGPRTRRRQAQIRGLALG